MVVSICELVAMEVKKREEVHVPKTLESKIIVPEKYATSLLSHNGESITRIVNAANCSLTRASKVFSSSNNSLG